MKKSDFIEELKKVKQDALEKSEAFRSEFSRPNADFSKIKKYTEIERVKSSIEDLISMVENNELGKYD